MANLAATQLPKPSGVTLTGSNQTPVAANAGGDSIPLVGSGVIVRVVNGGGSSITVTLGSVVPSNYGTDVDPVMAVAAGAFRKFYIPAALYSRFANASGYCDITYSAVTTVTLEIDNIP